IYTFLFFQVIAPDAVQDVIELSRQSALERDPEITDEQLEQGMQMFSFIMTPIGMAISGMLSQLITGAVISLITSIFLKKEDKSMTSSAI
ncbi:MAG: DUF4199 domain-containing protein, partial [Bacteroidota bacterium]